MHYYAVMPRVRVGGFLLMLAFASMADAQKWVTVWTGSVQGPYPVGNASVQPDLRFAFPSPQTGARDQTFRLIVLPDLWGGEARLRFSNAFGTRPVTIDGVFAGLHWTGGAVAPKTNRPVRFAGKPAVTGPAGGRGWRKKKPGGCASRATPP